MTIFTDTFTGNNGDQPASYWKNLVGFPEIQSNTLEISESESIDFGYLFSGDFDLQVDISASLGPSTNTWIMFLMASVDVTHFVKPCMAYEGSTKSWWTTTCSGGSESYSRAATRTVESGKLRITRTGSMAYMYYDSGSGFVSCGSASIGSGDVTVSLGASSWGSNPSITAQFDTFTITSGIIKEDIGCTTGAIDVIGNTAVVGHVGSVTVNTGHIIVSGTSAEIENNAIIQCTTKTLVVSGYKTDIKAHYLNLSGIVPLPVLTTSFDERIKVSGKLPVPVLETVFGARADGMKLPVPEMTGLLSRNETASLSGILPIPVMVTRFASRAESMRVPVPNISVNVSRNETLEMSGKMPIPVLRSVIESNIIRMYGKLPDLRIQSLVDIVCMCGMSGIIPPPIMQAVCELVIICSMSGVMPIPVLTATTAIREIAVSGIIPPPVMQPIASGDISSIGASISEHSRFDGTLLRYNRWSIER